MGHEKNKNINYYKEIEEYLGISEVEKSSIILLKKGIFQDFLRYLPAGTINSYMARSKNHVPSLNSSEFREWVLKNRTRFRISQSTLAAEVGARAEQINRFERGKKPLKQEFRIKIRDIIVERIKLQNLIRDN